MQGPGKAKRVPEAFPRGDIEISEPTYGDKTGEDVPPDLFLGIGHLPQGLQAAAQGRSAIISVMNIKKVPFGTAPAPAVALVRPLACPSEMRALDSRHPVLHLVGFLEGLGKPSKGFKQSCHQTRAVPYA